MPALSRNRTSGPFFKIHPFLQDLTPRKAAWILARAGAGLRFCIKPNKTTDAFGNALGESLAGQISAAQRETQLQQQEDARDDALAFALGGNPHNPNAPTSTLTITNPDLDDADNNLPPGYFRTKTGAIRKSAINVKNVFDSKGLIGFNANGVPLYEGDGPGQLYNPNRAIHTNYVATNLPPDANSYPDLGPVRITYSGGQGFLRYPKPDGEFGIATPPEGYDIPSLAAYQAGGIARGFINAGISTASSIGDGYAGLYALAFGDFANYKFINSKATFADFTPDKILGGLVESTFGVLTELNPYTGNPEKSGAHLFGALLNVAPAGAPLFKNVPILGADVGALSKSGLDFVGAGGKVLLINSAEKYGLPSLFPGVVSGGEKAIIGAALDDAALAAKNFVDELFKLPAVKSDVNITNLTERGTLTNLRPQDPAIAQSRVRTLFQDENGRYWLQGPSGNKITPSGAYDFVTLPNGTIKVSRPNTNPDFSTHLGLSGGGEVNFAGSIRFGNNMGPNRGTITHWTNNSGHYRPPASLSGNAGLPAHLFNPGKSR